MYVFGWTDQKLAMFIVLFSVRPNRKSCVGAQRTRRKMTEGRRRRRTGNVKGRNVRKNAKRRRRGRKNEKRRGRESVRRRGNVSGRGIGTGNGKGTGEAGGVTPTADTPAVHQTAAGAAQETGGGPGVRNATGSAAGTHLTLLVYIHQLSCSK